MITLDQAQGMTIQQIIDADPGLKGVLTTFGPDIAELPPEVALVMMSIVMGQILFDVEMIEAMQHDMGERPDLWLEARIAQIVTIIKQGRDNMGQFARENNMYHNERKPS